MSLPAFKLISQDALRVAARHPGIREAANDRMDASSAKRRTHLKGGFEAPLEMAQGFAQRYDATDLKMQTDGCKPWIDTKPVRHRWKSVGNKKLKHKNKKSSTENAKLKQEIRTETLSPGDEVEH